MSTPRGAELSRRLRRAVIAMQIQTPEPLPSRVDPRWYFAAVALLVLLIAAASARAALVFRAQVQGLEAQMVSVERANYARWQQRSAALIDYRQAARERQVEPPAPPRVVMEEAPEAVPQVAPEMASEAVAQEVHEAPRARAAAPVPTSTAVAPPPKAQMDREVVRVQVSARSVPAREPRSVEEAFALLPREGGERALAWLSRRAPAFRDSPAWEQFRRRSDVASQPHGQYQLGVLYGALDQHRQAYRWSRLASETSRKAEHLRAFAVAADKLGKRAEARAAYRRYLHQASPAQAAAVQARLQQLGEAP